jgi:HEAT repeat protein
LGVLTRSQREPEGQQAQVAAAQALLAIGSLPRLGSFVLGRAAATSPSPAVRAACLRALAALGAPRDSVALLTEALFDAHGEVRWTAACALAEIGVPARDALPALRTALQDVAPRIQSRFLEWVQQSFPRYSDDHRSRAATAAALLSLGDTELGLNTLQSHLDHEDWLVRQAALDAVFAARSAGPDLVLPLLEYGLHDSRPPVRRRAATLLGRLGSPASGLAGELGRRASSDPDPFVRQAALESALLLEPRTELAIALLAGRLSDPAVALRLSVVSHLERRVHDPRARAALRKAAADPDPAVRRAALAALEPPGDSP